MTPNMMANLQSWWNCQLMMLGLGRVRHVSEDAPVAEGLRWNRSWSPSPCWPARSAWV